MLVDLAAVRGGKVNGYVFRASCISNFGDFDSLLDLTVLSCIADQDQVTQKYLNGFNPMAAPMW